MGAVIVFFSAPTEGFHLLVVLLAAESLYLSVLTKKKKSVTFMMQRIKKEKTFFGGCDVFGWGTPFHPYPAPCSISTTHSSLTWGPLQSRVVVLITLVCSFSEEVLCVLSEQ